MLHFDIVGGTGIYAGRTGSGSAVLNDTTLLATPGLGFPLFVDSRG